MKIKAYKMQLNEGGALCLVNDKMLKYEGDSIIDKPSKVAQVIRDMMELAKEPEEKMIALGLNNRGAVVGLFVLSSGEQSKSLANISGAFKRLLLANCSAFVLAHNHPSGNTKPSAEDIETTRKYKEAGELLGVKLCDHLIIGADSYYSMLEGGLI